MRDKDVVEKGDEEKNEKKKGEDGEREKVIFMGGGLSVKRIISWDGSWNIYIKNKLLKDEKVGRRLSKKWGMNYIKRYRYEIIKEVVRRF